MVGSVNLMRDDRDLYTRGNRCDSPRRPRQEAPSGRAITGQPENVICPSRGLGETLKEQKESPENYFPIPSIISAIFSRSRLPGNTGPGFLPVSGIPRARLFPLPGLSGLPRLVRHQDSSQVLSGYLAGEDP
jgi:hypothetical protein